MTKWLLSFNVALVTLLCITVSLSAEDAGKVDEDAPPVKGTLYMIGGAADTSLRRFAELAGGEKALIAIIPHAADKPAEMADDLANKLKSFGVHNTVPILPNAKGVLPNGVTAVIFTGGDQNRLMRLLEADHELLKAVRDYYTKQGGLIGGTSAGAAAASFNMIAGGMGDGLPKAGALRLGKGMDLQRTCIFDTHVREEGRQDRLTVALASVNELIGIGLDEDTAVEINKDGKVLVHGTGLARLYRRAPNYESKLSGVRIGQTGEVLNVIVSIYPAGTEFDIP